MVEKRGSKPHDGFLSRKASSKVNNHPADTAPLPLVLISNDQDNRRLGYYRGRAANQFGRGAAGKSPVARTQVLKHLLELAHALYACSRPLEIGQIAELVEAELESIHPGDQWCVQHILALKARCAREAERPAEASLCVETIGSLGLNSTVLSDAWMERSRAYAATSMTPRAQEEWHIEMLYRLGLVVEMGGSETLSVQAAEAEFQKHLRGLQELFKLVPARPAEAVPVIQADAGGWARCPKCGFQFKVSDPNVFARGKHLRCKQKLTIAP